MKPATNILAIIMFAVLALGMQVGMKRPLDAELVQQVTDAFTMDNNWEGKTAPEFEIDTLDGQKFMLSEQVGKKIVILNFFATWCGPCKEEMPELNAFYGKNKESVVLLGIDADENEREVMGFVSDNKVAFAVGIDTDKTALRKKYGVSAYPTTVFIGVDGKVKLYEVGPITNSDVTFGRLMEDEQARLASGGAVGQEEYLINQASEDFHDVALKMGSDDDVELIGRAREISFNAYCMCGCDDLMSDCDCATGTKMKRWLEKKEFGELTDDEIIREMNAEFCGKDDDKG